MVKYNDIDNPYYEEYYSAADTVFLFNSKPFEQIVSFQFAIVNSKSPVYGYFSEDFDAIARGTRIIQGQFAVAMTDVYDLNRILGITRSEMDRSDYVAMKDVKDGVVYDEWIGKGFDITINYGAINGNLYDKIIQEDQNKVLEKDLSDFIYRNGTMLKLIDVHINNISQYIDANDSTCLMLIYNFFAKMAPARESRVQVGLRKKIKNNIKVEVEPLIDNEVYYDYVIPPPTAGVLVMDPKLFAQLCPPPDQEDTEKGKAINSQISTYSVPDKEDEEIQSVFDLFDIDINKQVKLIHDKNINTLNKVKKCITITWTDNNKYNYKFVDFLKDWMNLLKVEYSSDNTKTDNENYKILQEQLKIIQEKNSNNTMAYIQNQSPLIKEVLQNTHVNNMMPVNNMMISVMNKPVL